LKKQTNESENRRAGEAEKNLHPVSPIRRFTASNFSSVNQQSSIQSYDWRLMIEEFRLRQ